MGSREISLSVFSKLINCGIDSNQKDTRLCLF